MRAIRFAAARTDRLNRPQLFACAEACDRSRAPHTAIWHGAGVLVSYTASSRVCSSRHTYPSRPLCAAHTPVSAARPRSTILFCHCDWLRESRTGSAKLLTPSALSEVAFVQRTASTKQRKAARTIGVCSNSWSCLWERREKAARAPFDLRTHGCDRIAAAALQLSRALQK